MMGFFVFCFFRFFSENVAAEFSVFLFCKILRPVEAGACSFNRNKSTVVYSMKNKFCTYGLQLEIVIDRLLNPLMPNTFSCF